MAEQRMSREREAEGWKAHAIDLDALDREREHSRASAPATTRTRNPLFILTVYRRKVHFLQAINMVIWYN